MQKTPRTCRYGHGHLELLMGSFALAGLKPRRPPANALLAVSKYGSPRQPDGRYLALKVWSCPACGYVELVDSEDA